MQKNNKNKTAVLLVATLAGTLMSPSLMAGAPTSAPASASTSADDLAKKLANPVAAMISIPFQNNFDWGGGPDGDGFQYKVNFQPVIPFSLGKDWNLITRTIIPFVSQNNIVGKTSQSGLADTTLSMWLSPSEPTASGWIWGFGPAFLLPTGTNDVLTSDQWAAGPTAILLRSSGKFTYGMLINQLWAFAGGDDYENVNGLFIQPFCSYLPGGGWTFSLNTESSYNFTSNEWTIPLNLMANKMIKIGKNPAQWQLGARYYVEAPKNGPDWGMRCSLTFLLPRS